MHTLYFPTLRDAILKCRELSENLALLSEELRFKSVFDLITDLNYFVTLRINYMIDISHLSVSFRSVYGRFMIVQHRFTQRCMYLFQKFRSVEASIY